MRGYILPYPALLVIWGWLATGNGGFEVEDLEETRGKVWPAVETDGNMTPKLYN